MKTETRTKPVSYEVYITTDGREFTDKGVAQAHEDELSGKRKKCAICGGSGKVNGRYEERSYNASWVPTHSEKENVWVEDKCTECDGKGFKELKWS